MSVLGVDIGGSHITTALIDLQSRSLVPGTYHRERVNGKGTAAEIISSWSAVMQQSMQGTHKVGIAMPGPFDYAAGISLIQGLDKYDALYGLPVKALLAEALGIQPEDIIMNNDAACFLQGELFNGAAKGQRNVLGLTLGTGFGSAVATEGHAEDASFWCRPFLASRAEDYFSTRWFITRYEALSGMKEENVKNIAALADTSAAAAAVFREFSANLLMFLQTITPQPSMIVLGGNISHAHALFLKSLQLEGTQIVLSELGEKAALLGAASYWG
ncbi:ROK family protein [Chitinophaga sp. SYP-B3965]|uniref:ROK family protein n=1 Tax=Chitinophaga sp. SYP-B3965 TaxID=2663120 RepID=UPI00129960C3|nr:ROK family protein [Chitinophaga sp. SYP-B3965]MRG43897.1 ROK family protein [Chitinophaga sp. SYP-B3965]